MKIVFFLFIYIYLNASSYSEVIKFDPLLFEGELIYEENQEYFDEVIEEIKTHIDKNKEVDITISGYRSSYMDKVYEIFTEDIRVESNAHNNKAYLEKIRDYFSEKGIDSKNIFLEYKLNKVNDKNDLSNMVLVVMKVKKNHDTDNDGVENNLDRCPNTKLGTRIDEYGCKYKTLIMLLANKGKKNAIEVNTDNSSGVINEANSFVKLSSSDSDINIHPSMPESEIEAIFGTVLAVNYDKDSMDYNIYFDDSLEVTQESAKEIENVIIFLQEHEGAMIKIIGHTDTKGKKQLNIRLAQNRANYIVDIIKDSNVSYGHIDTESYGEFDLAVKTEDEIDEPLNRRVEILIR